MVAKICERWEKVSTPCVLFVQGSIDGKNVEKQMKRVEKVFFSLDLLDLLSPRSQLLMSDSGGGKMWNDIHMLRRSFLGGQKRV